MKTHGGRSFLHGHLFGDNVHEYLAPCIYEGRRRNARHGVLQVAGEAARQDLLRADRQGARRGGHQAAQSAQPARMPWSLASVAGPYLRWLMAERLRWRTAPELPTMPAPLRRHAEFACERLQRMSREISATMRKYQLKLADRQCRMTDLSRRCQDLIVLLCSSLYATRQSSEVVQIAAEVLGDSLRHRLTNERPDNKFYRRITQLGRDDFRKWISRTGRSCAERDFDAVLNALRREPEGVSLRSYYANSPPGADASRLAGNNARGCLSACPAGASPPVRARGLCIPPALDPQRAAHRVHCAAR